MPEKENIWSARKYMWVWGGPKRLVFIRTKLNWWLNDKLNIELERKKQSRKEYQSKVVERQAWPAQTAQTNPRLIYFSSRK